MSAIFALVVAGLADNLLWCVQVQTWAQSLVYSLEELECKICYNRYDTRSRKPKLLGCLHRVCAKCLKKMVDIGEFKSPNGVTRPDNKALRQFRG